MTSKDRAIVSLLWLFAKLPVSVNRRIGEFIGFVLWISQSRSRQVTEKNLQLCLAEYSSHRQTQLVRRRLQEVGKTMTEMGALWLWPQQQTMALIRQVHNQELLDQAITRQRGVIVLAPHLGNWEMLGLFLGQNYAATALYQPPQSAALDAIILRARGRAGTVMAPTNRRGVQALLETLKRGGVIGILPDQVPPLTGGQFAPFFDVSALTMTLVSSLLRKTGATAVCGYAERLPEGGFDIVFAAADESIYSTDVDRSLAGLNKSVEQCVRKIPAQYQWEYKRFKRRPEGEPPAY